MRLLALASAIACLASLPAAAHPALDARYIDAIRRAAAGYATWHRVDARPNLAPLLCRSPLASDFGAPSQVRRSTADDAAHGKKLYYLWASRSDEYLNRRENVAVGFAIVKQAFAAVPLAHRPPRDETPRDQWGLGEPPPIDTMTTEDGHSYKVGDAKGLYVIAKVGDLPGSDDGWIYGTVAADGLVTSAGRVASCMGCHDDAPREKLFGLQPAPR
jgi:hypothetical protein